LLNIVGGIRQSLEAKQNSASLSAAKERKVSRSPSLADENSVSDDKVIPEEEVELDLDDLTQEDKFYLI
jgi:hypothetical protein